MSKCNNDFFDSKKDWSRVKDALLGSYLPVYFAKVIHTKKPIVYIDCFAGAGKFKSGEDGSPRIALAERKSAIEHCRSFAILPKIDMYFIDPVYDKELAANISDYPHDDGHGSIKVIKGTYETTVPEILSNIGDANVFLYVDPFGIRNLANRIFANACKDFQGNVELLLNLNSFGFIREACRVTGTLYKGEKIELEEREDSTIDKSANAERVLSAIAGGEYWRKIIEDYHRDSQPSPKPSLVAERNFSACYRKTLSKSGGGPFKYVLDIPIKTKPGSYPKYRMVYATNHPDGCIAMADNMIRRADELYTEIQSGGQMSFFAVDANQEMKPDAAILTPLVRECLSRQTSSLQNSVANFPGIHCSNPSKIPVKIRLRDTVADFFCENGVICATKDIHSILASLENKGEIVVSRTPNITKTGKTSKFWVEDKDKTIYIHLKERSQ